MTTGDLQRKSPDAAGTGSGHGHQEEPPVSIPTIQPIREVRIVSGEAIEEIDAQVVEERQAPPNGQQVVVHNHETAVELFPGATPAEVIEQATAVADALKPILSAQDMTSRISGKDHVQIEGWQTLGALLKVTPVCVATRRIEPKAKFEVKGKKRKWGKVDGRRQVVEEFDYSYEVEGYSWEATVEARTLDGRVIGSADAMCSREEDKWKDADDYAIRSMAQTRASSKALASVLRFVVTLAGYSGTPAEEMPGQPDEGRQGAPPARAQAKRREGQGDGKSAQATAPQRRKMHAEASRLKLTEPQFKAWIEWNAGTPHTDRIEKASASKLIEMLEGYEDGAEALSAFNAALEAEDEKAQRIAAKHSGGGED